MLPTIDFNKIDDLIDYIDESIITNHDNEITAEQHNNIENGLAKFIIEAPRNWDRASVIGTAENYVAVEGECILIFKSTASGSITLTDNKWNEWTITNKTSENKQLVGGITSYRTIAGTIKNYISPLRSVTIAKGQDSIWYEISSSTTDTGELICNLFGVGSVFITGDDLDGSNIYYNSDLASALTVFFNGGNRYLILGSEWDYVKDIDSDVIGVQILFGSFTSGDVFVIAPNPKCGSGGGNNGVIHSPIQFSVGSGGQYVPDNGDTIYDNPNLIGNNNYTIYRQAIADYLFEGIDFSFRSGGGFNLPSGFIGGERFTLTFYA